MCQFECEGYRKKASPTAETGTGKVIREGTLVRPHHAARPVHASHSRGSRAVMLPQQGSLPGDGPRGKASAREMALPSTFCAGKLAMERQLIISSEAKSEFQNKGS